MNLLLCEDLRVVLDFEIANSNAVLRVDAPANAECDYAVVFSQPLKISISPQSEQLLSGVEYWECEDSHHSIEGGYLCSKHRHAVVGPLHD